MISERAGVSVARKLWAVMKCPRSSRSLRCFDGILPTASRGSSVSVVHFHSSFSGDQELLSFLVDWER